MSSTTRRSFVVAVTGIAAPIVRGRAIARGLRDLDLTEQPMALAGKWKKVSSAGCDEAYPDEIEFFERPRYLGRKGPRQTYIVWDAGGYQVTDPNQVMIETATDEQVLYRFSIAENVLTFKDRADCEFTYRRVD